MRLRRKSRVREALKDFPAEYLIIAGAEENYRGQWRELLAADTLTLEIGCGKGALLNKMAELEPQHGFIGMETQGEIAFLAAEKVLAAERRNLKIICANAEQLDLWFAEGEIDELLLNFSDPWPKARHAKRRLTYRAFLARYQKILRPGAQLKLRTDNQDFFGFSAEELKIFGAEILAVTYDLHNSEYASPVMTEYEQKFSALGQKICYLAARFK